MRASRREWIVIFAFGASTALGLALGMVDTVQNLQTGFLLGIVLAMNREI